MCLSLTHAARELTMFDSLNWEWGRPQCFYPL